MYLFRKIISSITPKNVLCSLICFLKQHWGCVYPPRKMSNFNHPICSPSCSSWAKFDKCFSFCNKAHVVLRRNRAALESNMVSTQSVCMLGYEIESTCGCGCFAVLNMARILVNTLPAVYSPSPWSTRCIPVVEFGLQPACWVNLSMSLLWQAGQWVIYCLNCLSSTPRTLNRQLCPDFKTCATSWE